MCKTSPFWSKATQENGTLCWQQNISTDRCISHKEKYSSMNWAFLLRLLVDEAWSFFTSFLAFGLNLKAKIILSKVLFSKDLSLKKYFTRRTKKQLKFLRLPLKEQKKDRETKYVRIDSFQGDSGSPLWKWVGKGRGHAVMIGVLSRGTGCAHKNTPGIYTRVKKYLRWIFAKTWDGKCK